MNMIRWQKPVLPEWPSWNRLNDLRTEIDRLFEAPFAELSRSSQWLSGWIPSLDLYEDKDQLTVQVELPGMKKDDISISLHDGSLSISGERRSDEKFEEADVYRAERYVGRFQRTIQLPSPVAADRVKAQYKDGILTITLPKTDEAKPKQINVQEG